MPAASRHRIVHITCIAFACVMALLAVTWGGGAVAAWAGQTGKPRATARVLATDGNRSSGHLVVEFTTRDGRTVSAEDRRSGWPRDARRGGTVEIVYSADDPAGDVAPFQDVGASLPWTAAFAVVAALSGLAAFRTRAGPRVRGGR
ncbi:DUF3592 domain-containing protein [Actinomadura darangshiensis]|uniref:DUF3592 domain-containing protein n=1 Tax=Actinomadura darangshiensis TaxID=705336 RepID=A0A4R5BG97_9ACTN|nr:DUF3592 domain-containing protein [Actinomadura darangshiensis]TDD83920.1 DUF3592 domain-containing protein [Actinomadura darangshiensis]